MVTASDGFGVNQAGSIFVLLSGRISMDYAV